MSRRRILSTIQLNFLSIVPLSNVDETFLESSFIPSVYFSFFLLPLCYLGSFVLATEAWSNKHNVTTILIYSNNFLPTGKIDRPSIHTYIWWQFFLFSFWWTKKKRKKCFEWSLWTRYLVTIFIYRSGGIVANSEVNKNKLIAYANGTSHCAYLSLIRQLNLCSSPLVIHSSSFFPDKKQI